MQLIISQTGQTSRRAALACILRVAQVSHADALFAALIYSFEEAAPNSTMISIFLSSSGVLEPWQL